MVRVRVSLIQRLNRLRNFIINPRVHTLRIYDSANFFSFFFFLFHSLNPEGIRGTIDTTCIKRVGTTMTRHVAYRERFSQIEKPPGEDTRPNETAKRRRLSLKMYLVWPKRTSFNEANHDQETRFHGGPWWDTVSSSV